MNTEKFEDYKEKNIFHVMAFDQSKIDNRIILSEELGKLVLYIQDDSEWTINNDNMYRFRIPDDVGTDKNSGMLMYKEITEWLDKNSHVLLKAFNDLCDEEAPYNIQDIFYDTLRKDIQQ